MDAIVDDLADQQAELAALLRDLGDDDWSRPSPCEGWSLADVVLHLAQTDEMALGSATGQFAETLESLTVGLGFAADVDQGADLMVANQRHQPPEEIRARWETGAQRLEAALRRLDPGRRVVGVAGELSARTLATTRLAETWIHTGDVASALGRRLQPTDRLRPIARLAWRTLPYAFGRAGRTLTGPVALDLAGPHGDRWRFDPDEPAATVVHGDAVELCLVAARRLDPADTALNASGPDAGDVLRLIRTYA